MATYNVKVAWRGESVHEVEADNAKDAAEKVMGPGGEMDSGCFEIDYPDRAPPGRGMGGGIQQGRRRTMKPIHTDDETLLAALRRGEPHNAITRRYQVGNRRLTKLARKHGLEFKTPPGPASKGPASPEVEALVLAALQAGSGRRIISTMFDVGERWLARFADEHGIGPARSGRKPGSKPERRRRGKRPREARPAETGLAQMHRLFVCVPRPSAVEGRPRWAR